MTEFSKEQNKTFQELFGHIKLVKPKANFETQAHTMLDLDEGNFINLYNDPCNLIVGTDEEIAKVKERAKFLCG